MIDATTGKKEKKNQEAAGQTVIYGINGKILCIG